VIRAVLFDVGETLVERISDRDVPLRGQSMTPFPDTDASLAEIKRAGYRLAAVSNTEQSDDDQLADILTRAGLRRHFDVLVTSISVGERKPAPAMFLKALERLGCRPDEAVMVGDDARVDIAGAARLGLPTILVVRPGSSGPVAGIAATFTVSSLAKVQALLVRLNADVMSADTPLTEDA
jgi:HAD superfamily hydrolase (TIGR01662 family)